MEEEAAPALSAEFGAEFAALLQTGDDSAVITPARFDELRADAAVVVARDAGSTDSGATRARAAAGRTSNVGSWNGSTSSAAWCSPTSRTAGARPLPTSAR